jgi:serine/threonine protein phosphatase PrpC
MYPVGAGASDVGRLRDQNEDSFYLDDERRLYVVADGMGGHSGGEIASSVAIDTVSKEIGKRHEEIRKLRKGKLKSDALSRIVQGAVEAACTAVYEKAQESPLLAGMGCTLTALLVVDNKAVMAHVGDTRLYLAREHNVSQLSTDHTMANELANAGLIERDEVADHQYASVLSRAVGTKPTVMVDTLVLDIVPGDRFLLCSDGLHDYIENESWLLPQLSGDDLETVAEELVSYANSVGGRDNITALIIDIHADEPEIEIVDEMSVDVSHQFLALESVFLFEGLSMALLARVLNHCELEVFAADDVVIEQGAPCSQLMVVVDGRFEVSRDGKVDGVLTAGEHSGATTLLGPRKARATLKALERSRLLTLHRRPFWKLIRARPWLGVGLLERLGRRLSVDLDRTIEQLDEADRAATPAATPSVAPREIL